MPCLVSLNKSLAAKRDKFFGIIYIQRCFPHFHTSKLLFACHSVMAKQERWMVHSLAECKGMIVPCLKTMADTLDMQDCHVLTSSSIDALRDVGLD